MVCFVSIIILYNGIDQVEGVEQLGLEQLGQLLVGHGLHTDTIQTLLC